MKPIKFIDEPLKEPQKIMRDGLQSDILRTNEVFVDVVNTLYDELTGHEDSISSSQIADLKEAEDVRLYYSKMRVMLVRLVQELDYRIQLAETEKDQQENEAERQGE